jgi:hypothetical protein
VTGAGERAVSDPVGLITDLVTAAEPGLAPEQARAVITAVAGGRAKSRRLAVALASRPAVLADGRSPALRAVADLLIALRAAGARQVSPPRCAGCGKELRSFQRRGQDWFCPPCGRDGEACAACGKIRPVSARDRSGQPRCVKCPDSDGRDPVAVIHAVIAALDPDASPAAVAAAVLQAAPRPSYQQKLAWVLEEHPALLTGEGHLAPLRAIPRFIDLLLAAGVVCVVRPACGRCRRVVRIDKPLDGVRVCRSCIARSRREQCARCGASREPVTRDDKGRPVCANCFITDPVNLETCAGCGRRSRVERRTPHGPLCPGCPSLPVATCSVCGRTAPCGTSRSTGLRWCPDCQHRTAVCSACGHHAPVVSGTLASPRCARCTPPPPWAGCLSCSDPGCHRPGQCERCLLSKQLGKVMGPAGDPLPPGLQALRRELAGAEHPGTAMRWLTKASVAPVLAGLAAGRIALTHEALDELPGTPALAHLRQTLVTVGALPGRDEEMVRLDAFLTARLDGQQDAERRRILHRYLIWHQVRRLRSRNAGEPATRQQSVKIRQLARAAIAFLDWLGARDLTLASCQQADLDQWLTDDQAVYRPETGQFIRWARASKLTSVYLPASRWNGPGRPLDHQDRWDTARRLLHDDQLKPEDRLAGLLVLLYAQGATAICRMTVSQVQATGNTALLRIGRVPVQLPEPVATLARTVAASRKGHATIGARQPSPWLFPGGQPGRPVSAARLTRRLEALGIRPGQARSTTLFQLAAEVPAAILARTLGISTDVAVTWQRISSGDWTAYAADVSRRTTNPARHSDSSNI